MDSLSDIETAPHRLRATSVHPPNSKFSHHTVHTQTAAREGFSLPLPQINEFDFALDFHPELFKSSDDSGRLSVATTNFNFNSDSITKDLDALLTSYDVDEQPDDPVGSKHDRIIDSAFKSFIAPTSHQYHIENPNFVKARDSTYTSKCAVSSRIFQSVKRFLPVSAAPSVHSNHRWSKHTVSADLPQTPVEAHLPNSSRPPSHSTPKEYSKRASTITVTAPLPPSSSHSRQSSDATVTSLGRVRRKSWFSKRSGSIMTTPPRGLFSLSRSPSSMFG